MKYSILPACLLVLFISCKTGDPVIEKKVSPVFRTYKGTAKIISIIPAKENNGNDNGSFMELYFNFIPSDSAEAKRYQFPEAPDSNILLKYDNRKSFHKNWIMKWGLKNGNEYPATRYEASGKVTGAHVYYDVELSPAK
jgi:hypothetical protein